MFQGGTRNLPGRNRDVTPYQDRVIFSFTLAPPGFVGKAEKARREAAAKEERRAHCGGSETSRGSRCPRKIGPDPDCRPPRFLSMTELEALDREVLADPEVRASYEKQFPGFRRVYLELLRKARIRVKLNLPAPSGGLRAFCESVKLAVKILDTVASGGMAVKIEHERFHEIRCVIEAGSVPKDPSDRVREPFSMATTTPAAPMPAPQKTRLILAIGLTVVSATLSLWLIYWLIFRQADYRLGVFYVEASPQSSAATALLFQDRDAKALSNKSQDNVTPLDTQIDEFLKERRGRPSIVYLSAPGFQARKKKDSAATDTFLASTTLLDNVLPASSTPMNFFFSQTPCRINPAA